METAAPATLVGRIIAVIAIAVVALTGLPFLRDKHLQLEDVHVEGDRVSAFGRQHEMSYRAAIDRSRGELGWAAAGAIGLIAVVLESIAYQRAIRARRRASGSGAIARFAPVAIAGAAAVLLGYPIGSTEVEPGLGLLVMAAATGALVLLTGQELAACMRGQRGWTGPPPEA